MTTILNKAVEKTRWRLISFMLSLYILAFLDRANIGFAKESYQIDTGLSNEAFAMGREYSSSLMLFSVRREIY